MKGHSEVREAVSKLVEARDEMGSSFVVPSAIRVAVRVAGRRYTAVTRKVHIPRTRGTKDEYAPSRGQRRAFIQSRTLE